MLTGVQTIRGGTVLPFEHCRVFQSPLSTQRGVLKAGRRTDPIVGPFPVEGLWARG